MAERISLKAIDITYLTRFNDYEADTNCWGHYIRCALLCQDGNRCIRKTCLELLLVRF
jgi:hypothetical protein